MPQASSFTSKVRTYSEGRNNKVQYPGGIAKFNELASLTCNPSLRWSPLVYKESCKKCSNLEKPSDLPLGDPSAVLTYYDNDHTELQVTWYNLPPQIIDVEFYEFDGSNTNNMIIKLSNIDSLIGFAKTDKNTTSLGRLQYFYAIIVRLDGGNIQTDNLNNTNYIGSVPSGGI